MEEKERVRGNERKKKNKKKKDRKRKGNGKCSTLKYTDIIDALIDCNTFICESFIVYLRDRLSK